MDFYPKKKVSARIEIFVSIGVKLCITNTQQIHKH